MKNRAVPFLRIGCEELLGHMFSLGIEARDVLNEAPVYLIRGLANWGLELPEIQWVEGWSGWANPNSFRIATFASAIFLAKSLCEE